MRPVGSVTAFLARHARQPGADPAAVEILAGLDAEARLAVDAQAQPAHQRAAWLQERSGEAWSAARLAHVEQRAFVEIRRALQHRGLWQY